MNLEALPDIPGGWIEYVKGAHPELPAPSFASLLDSLQGSDDERGRESGHWMDAALEALHGSGALRGSGKRPWGQGTVAVVAPVYADLFGGNLSQLLKCLTAARLAEELSRHSVDALAVCWIRPYSGRGYSLGRTLNLLDPQGRLHKFLERAQEWPGGIPDGMHVYEGKADLIARVEKLGAGRFNEETLALLKTADLPGNSEPARIFEMFLRPWRGIVVDARARGFDEALEKSGNRAFPDLPATSSASFSAEAAIDYQRQCLLFPRPLFVLDPWDYESFVQARSMAEERFGRSPLCWPAASATIVDKDSRRTLRKYGLSFEDLLASGPGLLQKLEEEISANPAGQKLKSLELQLQESLEPLGDPSTGSRSFRKAREECRERILYQLRKIGRRFEGTRVQRLEILQRRISRLRPSLMPDGRMQELRLSAAHFLLAYGMALPEVLYENLNIESFEHHTIDLY